MLPPSVVVFDLDGTLVDSKGDIAAAANHALQQAGRHPLPTEVLLRYVGDGARMLCARAAGLGEQDPAVDALVADFTAYYLEHPIDHTKFMPHAYETLETLGAMQNMSLAICTNKPRAATEAVLSGFGVRTRFRAVSAGDDASDRKPAPGPLFRLAKELGVKPTQMVMVGDSPQDVECARKAGSRSVAVRGFASRDRLIDARPDVLMDDMSELAEVIQRWVDATVRLTTPRPV